MFLFNRCLIFNYLRINFTFSDKKESELADRAVVRRKQGGKESRLARPTRPLSTGKAPIQQVTPTVQPPAAPTQQVAPTDRQPATDCQVSSDQVTVQVIHAVQLAPCEAQTTQNNPSQCGQNATDKEQIVNVRFLSF